MSRNLNNFHTLTYIPKTNNTNESVLYKFISNIYILTKLNKMEPRLSVMLGPFRGQRWVQTDGGKQVVEVQTDRG